MIFKISYGKTGYDIELSDNLNIDVIEPRWIESVKDPHEAIAGALRKPYNSISLKTIAGANLKVGIVFSDITRATPYNIILPALLAELGNIPTGNITFFCANGTHRPVTHEELISILGDDIVRNFKIVQNNAFDRNLHEYAGTTSSGNEIFLNKEILGCDIKILTGFIEPHFFAGYSGGGKALIPGMSYIDTIKHNHSIENLSGENSRWGITEGNPVWEDIMEAAGFIPGLFLLNITLNREKNITNVFAGDLKSAHQKGCQFVKESAMVPVDKLYDIVITSNSGYPLDLNVYQTVKGMSAASQIVKPGGIIIMAAECWDGIPSGSDYESILKTVGVPGRLMDYIKENESDLQDTWQIFFQALIQQKAEVYLFSDKLADKSIENALLRPVNDIGRLTDDLAGKIGTDVRICILPDGPQTIPFLKK